MNLRDLSIDTECTYNFTFTFNTMNVNTIKTNTVLMMSEFPRRVYLTIVLKFKFYSKCQETDTINCERNGTCVFYEDVYLINVLLTHRKSTCRPARSSTGGPLFNFESISFKIKLR